MTGSCTLSAARFGPVLATHKETCCRWFSSRSGRGSWIISGFLWGFFRTEQNVDDCQAIHEDLLACAEEVCYPTAMHLLKLVQSLGDVPLEGWEQACQDYVLEQ